MKEEIDGGNNIVSSEKTETVLTKIKLTIENDLREQLIATQKSEAARTDWVELINKIASLQEEKNRLTK